jgi:phage regulator Rha-like protein
MSTISELRAAAKATGQELVKRFNELENAEKQILAEKAQIKSQVDGINGEIAAYNKIEPPVTEVEPTSTPEPVE